MNAFEKLSLQLAELEGQAEHTLQIWPDELGDGMEKVLDFETIGTDGYRSIRLDVWHDPETDTNAGVRYSHRDDVGAGPVKIVKVHLVPVATWRVAT